jgi:hypothetical protein
VQGRAEGRLELLKGDAKQAHPCPPSLHSLLMLHFLLMLLVAYAASPTCNLLRAFRKQPVFPASIGFNPSCFLAQCLLASYRSLPRGICFVYDSI